MNKWKIKKGGISAVIFDQIFYSILEPQSNVPSSEILGGVINVLIGEVFWNFISNYLKTTCDVDEFFSPSFYKKCSPSQMFFRYFDI